MFSVAASSSCTFFLVILTIAFFSLTIGGALILALWQKLAWLSEAHQREAQANAEARQLLRAAAVRIDGLEGRMHQDQAEREWAYDDIHERLDTAVDQAVALENRVGGLEARVEVLEDLTARLAGLALDEMGGGVGPGVGHWMGPGMAGPAGPPNEVPREWGPAFNF